MRCDEIQERLIDLLYMEGGIPPESQEVRDHLGTCLACRREFEELKQTRKYLQTWKDEAPLRPVPIATPEAPLLKRRSHWRYLGYAAIAAMALICFLALANTEIRYDKNGFSMSTHLFTPAAAERDYYTKSESRDLVKRALDDSEFRSNEVNYLMMQKMLDTVERDRWMDLHLARGRAARNTN